jgi:GAF domain-containing protein/anti-sigma regulatory factor (Ser/Thr protein kinase)
MLESLQRVTDAALAYLPAEELLNELLERITAILHVDTAAILLLEPDGEMLRARAAKGIEEEVEQNVRIPVGAGFAGRIAATRAAFAIEDIDRADIYNPILRQKGIRSLLGVPLLVSGRILGVLHVGSLTPRVFDDDDRELLQLAGDRAAIAIEHAQLFEEERADRRRLESLQRITDAALAYLPADELLNELLERITAILDVDTAAILLLEPSGETLRARAAKGIEEEVEEGVHIPVGAGFAGRIAATHAALAIDVADDADLHNPILRRKGIRSLLGVPLLVSGRILGVLHVGSLTPRVFDDDDRELLQLAGDRAAIAIEHAQLFEQRLIAETLQRRLLPQELPAIAGLELAARYLPAAGSSLGGDWYDVFELPGGRVVLAVGDVVGHGVAAAAVMAQLRTALRAYAIEEHPAATVVEAVNRMMWELGPVAMTTLAYAVLDPAEEELELVLAGHPPPLLLAADGDAGYLPLQGAIALGAAPGSTYKSQTMRFPAGAMLVLYTDGLVERRGPSIDDGLERLRELAAGLDDVEAVCTDVVDRMVSDEPDDDVAAIAARLPPLSEDLRTRWPAQPEALVAVRHLLRRWLRAHGASEDEAYEILVACQEACANAVEHAYAPGRAHFEVDASSHEARIRITIRDRGRWREPRGTHRGRGLALMRSLMQTVEVEHGDDGTVVVLERSLGSASAA